MTVLFVHNDPKVLHDIAEGMDFAKLGIERVCYARDIPSTMDALEKTPADLMFIGAELPEEDSIELNRQVMERHPKTVRVLLVSAVKGAVSSEFADLGLYDCVRWPIPFEELETLLRRALQYIFERVNEDQLYQLGLAMRTSRTELLDQVALNLFSRWEEDVESSIRLLNLMGYPLTTKKQTQLLVLSIGRFLKPESLISLEKDIHETLSEALKEADITYPTQSIIAVDHRRRFLVLLFSAAQDEYQLPEEQCRLFFNCLTRLMLADVIHCAVQKPVPLEQLGIELELFSKVSTGGRGPSRGAADGI